MKMLTEILKETNPNVFPEEYILYTTPHQIVANSFVTQPGQLAIADIIGVFSEQQADRIGAKIIELAQQHGMFQIINHGIRDNMMIKAMRAANNFFELPVDQLKSESEWCLFYSSSAAQNFNMESGAKYWRDTLPLNLSSTPVWPRMPPHFKVDVQPLAFALEQLANRLLCLIGKSLNIGETYFSTHELDEVRRLNVNRYPKCPNPQLTCGLPKHCDPDLLTITYIQPGEGAKGLEVFIDNQWKRVVPRSDALIVTIGSQMQVVTNKRLQAPLHRVVVNSECNRTSISYAVAPSDKAWVQPAEMLTGTQGSRYVGYNYGAYRYKHLTRFRDTPAVLSEYEL